MSSSEHHPGKHGEVIFFNEDVTLTDKEVEVHWYYFPTGTSKHIPYDHLEHAELLQMKDVPFLETKTWGMGMSMTWWHCDFSRLSRQYVIMLTLKNQNIRVAITTDDHEVGKIYDLIRKHMVHQ